MEESSRGAREPGASGPQRRTEPVQLFEVRVTGLVPEDVLPQLAHVDVVEHELRTSLQGRFRDQAELHGFLARLRAFGLEVVEVRRLAAPLAPDNPGSERP